MFREPYEYKTHRALKITIKLIQSTAARRTSLSNSLIDYFLIRTMNKWTKCPGREMLTGLAKNCQWCRTQEATSRCPSARHEWTAQQWPEQTDPAGPPPILACSVIWMQGITQVHLHKGEPWQEFSEFFLSQWNSSLEYGVRSRTQRVTQAASWQQQQGWE